MDSIPTLTDREGPFHFRIVAALAADIESGGPLRGQELSMHRELAKTLGIDLTTMTRAYTEARHPGLTQARSGQGTFVVESLSCPTRCVGQRLGFDLSMIFPPNRLDSDLGRLTRGLTAIQREVGLSALLTYQDAGDLMRQETLPRQKPQTLGGRKG